MGTICTEINRNTENIKVILKHLRNTYGQMSLTDKMENERQWVLGWDPSEPTESLFGRLKEWYVVSIINPPSPFHYCTDGQQSHHDNQEHRALFNRGPRVERIPPRKVKMERTEAIFHQGLCYQVLGKQRSDTCPRPPSLQHGGRLLQQCDHYHKDCRRYAAGKQREPSTHKQPHLRPA
jgi:hypothetical protein